MVPVAGLTATCVICAYMYHPRYDNVTLILLVLHLGLQIGPIQHMAAVPGVIHTGRFFVLIPL